MTLTRIQDTKEDLYNLKPKRWYIWVSSQQDAVFHFLKANRLYEKELILPRW